MRAASGIQFGEPSLARERRRASTRDTAYKMVPAIAVDIAERIVRDILECSSAGVVDAARGRKHKAAVPELDDFDMLDSSESGASDSDEDAAILPSLRKRDRCAGVIARGYLAVCASCTSLVFANV